MRRRLLAGLRIGLGLGLLVLLVSRVHPADYAALWHGEPAQLLLGLGLLFLSFPVLQALRLHVLVVRYTETVARTFVVFMVGAFFNTLLPSNIGGDAVRLLYLKRARGANWGGPFAMLMLHRASGLGVLLVAAAVHVAFNWSRLLTGLASVHVERGLDQRSVLIALVALLCGAGLALLIGTRFRTRALARLRMFAAESLEALREVGWGPACLLIVLTALFHFARMLAFFVLLRYAGEHIALLDLLPVLAATALAGIVPLSVGGLGLMEGAISVTLTLFGVGQTAAIAAALANRAVLLVSAALGGVVYVASGGAHNGAGRAPAEGTR